MHESIETVMSYKPKSLYLTHYGSITPSARIIAGLHEQIDDYVMLTDQAADSDGELAEVIEKKLNDYLVRRCLNEIDTISEATAKEWIHLDAKLNAQGLAFWHQHRREK